MDKTKMRDPWLDNIKGILMILVVVNHMNATLVKYSNTVELIYMLINFFHMPCFMFITGYLSKGRINRREYDKTITRLVVPYFTSQFLIWAFCCMFPYALEQISWQTTKSITWLTPNYHLWYLFAVMVYCLITPSLLDLVKKKPVLLLPIAFFLSVIVGYGQEVLYMRFNKVVAYYPLFLLGYFAKKDWVFALRDNKKLKIAGAGILAIWVTYFFFHFKNIYVNVFSLATSYAKYPAPYDGSYPVRARIVFLIVAPVISLAFMSLVTKKHTIFTHIGERSMYVYVLHGLFIIALRTIDRHFYPFVIEINNPPKKIAYMLAGVALTFVLASSPVKYLFRFILEPNVPFLTKKKENQA